jgi:hypothetical protein
MSAMEMRVAIASGMLAVLHGSTSTVLTRCSPKPNASRLLVERHTERLCPRTAATSRAATVPIPRSDDDVLEMLDRLEADRKEVRQNDIDDFEADIDEAVYDLFDLTEGERKVVEDYLDVF